MEHHHPSQDHHSMARGMTAGCSHASCDLETLLHDTCTCRSTDRKAYCLVRVDEDRRLAWPASDGELEWLAEKMAEEKGWRAIQVAHAERDGNKGCGKQQSQYRAGGPCDHCGVTGA